MLKRIAFVCLLVAGVLMVTMGVAGAQDAQLKFKMVAHGDSTNPFWIVVIKGMEDACTLLDADCQWLGDDKLGSPAMAGFWEDALNAEPDGIGTTVADPEVIRSGVDKAKELGIPGYSGYCLQHCRPERR